MATAEMPPKTDTPLAFAPLSFEVNLQQIAEMREEYMALAITDVNDKAEVAAVHDARMVCVKLRRGVEKYAKEMRDEANKYSKSVIAAERSLTVPIAEIEAHLEREENKVKAEQDRIKREAEEKRHAVVRERLRLLSEAGATYLASDVEYMPQPQFDALLSDKQRDKKAREETIAAEAAERARVMEANRIEAEKLANDRAEHESRIAAERAEIERVKKEQAAAQAKIDAERKRIDDEQLAEQRRLQLERAKAEAAKNARLESFKEREREEARAKAKAAAAEAEVKRLESLRPDREKLLVTADTVEAIKVPPVSVNAAKAATRIEELLAECAIDIREVVANELTAGSAA